jgi:GWxTD domain-containing protein
MLTSFNMISQVTAYFNYATFNTPENKPYIETYLTIAGRSLVARKINGELQNSVNIEVKILKDSNIVKAAKYNLMGPLFTGTNSPSFIDNQRYSLPNGNYKIQLTLNDNYGTTKPLRIEQPVEINYNNSDFRMSMIQPLESFKKVSTPGPLTKSGYDLVPYNVNYYPESSNTLAFYCEAYNADTAIGREQPFVFYYYISSENGSALNTYGAFKKQVAAKINPFIGQIDISKLGTGNYYLVVQVKDAHNKVRASESYFFQRLNRAVDIIALQDLSEKQNVARYFGAIKDPDTLKMFVECLWPIADNIDKERVINHATKKDPDLMKKFVIDFWQRRAADTANPLKLWATYYQSVQQVMVLFKCGKQKGYYTERGRVYLQYGPPNQRSQQPN